MNRIITVGRQFGSGGRELGKRLADELGIPYYDKEILQGISEKTKLAEEYISKIVEKRPGYYFPITVGRTLHGIAPDYLMHQYADIYAEQSNVIREMAEKSDCVIVGRCADYILQDHKPLRLFVYADLPERIARCKARAENDENMTEKELKKKILKVDKDRAKYYLSYTGLEWGKRENYDLCINTGNLNIKETAHALAMLWKQNG